MEILPQTKARAHCCAPRGTLSSARQRWRTGCPKAVRTDAEATTRAHARRLIYWIAAGRGQLQPRFANHTILVHCSVWPVIAEPPGGFLANTPVRWPKRLAFTEIGSLLSKIQGTTE